MDETRQVTIRKICKLLTLASDAQVQRISVLLNTSSFRGRLIGRSSPPASVDGGSFTGACLDG